MNIHLRHHHTLPVFGPHNICQHGIHRNLLEVDFPSGQIVDPLWHFGGEIWRFQNLRAVQLSTEASNFFLQTEGIWCSQETLVSASASAWRAAQLRSEFVLSDAQLGYEKSTCFFLATKTLRHQNSSFKSVEFYPFSTHQRVIPL